MSTKKIWKNFKRNFVQLTERVLEISDWFINAFIIAMPPNKEF